MVRILRANQEKILLIFALKIFNKKAASGQLFYLHLQAHGIGNLNFTGIQFLEQTLVQ